MLASALTSSEKFEPVVFGDLSAWLVVPRAFYNQSPFWGQMLRWMSEALAVLLSLA